MTNQFTKPYGPVEPVLGDRPLLTILLEPSDRVSPRDIDVIALNGAAELSRTLIRLTRDGADEGYYLPSSGEYADPLPGGRRFQGSPALLVAPDASVVSAFAIDDGGSVLQTSQGRSTSEDDWRGWSSWAALPATTIPMTEGVAVMNSPDGDLASMFALGVDGHIHQAVYARGPTGGWQPWTKLPGSQRFESAPAVMNSPDGDLASVFALGVDGHIHQAVYARGPTGGWQPWTKLPGAQRFESAPAVMNSPDGRLALVFALGIDGYIHRTVYDRETAGGWRSWTMLPGGERLNSAPAVSPRLLHRSTRDHVRSKLFGSSTSLQKYFAEVSYGKFTFVEAETTPWLTALDDPATPEDESRYEYVHAGGIEVETAKGGRVLEHVEQLTNFEFSKYDGFGPHSPDGRLTADELSVLWLYTGGGGGGVRRPVPLVPVPSLSVGVDIGALIRCGSMSGIGLMAHEFAHWPLQLMDLYPAMHIRRMAISSVDDHVYTWFDNGTVCSGASWQLDAYSPRVPCTYPGNRSASDLVGVGIAGDGHVYAWYRDGFVSAGTPEDLASHRPPQPFEPAPGRTPNDIVDVAILPNDYVFAWYMDGTVSVGSSTKLYGRQKTDGYDLAGEYTPSDVLGIGMAGSNDCAYAWYKDGTVSAGTAYDLEWHHSRYVFRPPAEANPGPGRLSLMDNPGSGPNVSHLDPWAKMKLGWLEPTEVKQPGMHPLPDVETHPTAYILHDPNHQHEYFIVENRQPGTSFESDLGGGGLAIWHIHERQPITAHWDHWSRKTVHLVKPLGLDLRNERNGSNSSTPSDYLWDGSDPRRSYDLHDDSIPANTRWDDGSPSGIAIRNISASGPNMKVFFDVP